MEVTGDLLEMKVQFIAHQTNCVTNKSIGLAKSLAVRYPHSDIYSNRVRPDVPGTIEVTNDGSEPSVIGMMAQYYPGKAKFKNDSHKLRIEWFKECLDRILEIDGLESIAFPYGIGCGYGGGKWDIYHQMIIDFSKRTEAKVFIVKLP